MKKILAIGGSNSSSSINRKLAIFAASQLQNIDLLTFDLSQISLPLFGVDEQSLNGIPKAAEDLIQVISSCDGIILSVAEHNGNITASFKNLWDWASRVEKKVWQNKPLFLLSTSPGGRGALSAFNIVKQVIPFYGGNIKASFSLPNFYDNIGSDQLQDNRLDTSFRNELSKFEAALLS